MQVTVEDLSTVKKILHVEISEEDVKREVDKAYKELKKTAKVKGFRPGKVPRSVLEGMYKKNVNADVSSKLIQDSFLEAIRETDLKILGNPGIDPPEFDGKGSYKYDATVEISPELEEIDFKGLTLEKTLYQLSNGEVDAQLKMLQKNLTRLQPIAEDRTAREGDFVLIDYEGFKDGKPFAETEKTENFTMKIGDGQISKDLDDKLIGMTKGENREITVKFPEDYFNDKLANLEIAFQVTLKEIREEVIPEIDDEFAKKLGKYETLDELKTEIIDHLKQGYAKRVEQELNEQIFKALITRKDFEVPDVLIDSELESIITEAERSFAFHNRSMEDLGLTREKLSEKYRDTAEKQVKRYLILNKIAEQEDMKLSDEDLENGFKEMSETFHQPIDEIKNYYNQNKDKLEFFKHTLLEKQAIRLIIDESDIKEVEPEEKAIADK